MNIARAGRIPNKVQVGALAALPLLRRNRRTAIWAFPRKSRARKVLLE
jgi:hypothetical protein